MPGNATASECLLARYLDSTGRNWVREPSLGAVRPDFIVGGHVVCEVTSFTKDRLPERVGARDALLPIRLKIRDKWPQAEAARAAGHPFLLVLHQEGHETDLTPTTLAAALLGNLTVGMTFDAEQGAAVGDSALVFGEGGSTEIGNRNLSAAAILRDFNPTLVDLQDAWRQVQREGSVTERLAARTAIKDDLIVRGTFDPQAIAPRLIVIHSRTPAIALALGWLGGPYDEEWAIDQQTGELRRQHVGALHGRVPQG